MLKSLCIHRVGIVYSIEIALMHIMEMQATKMEKQNISEAKERLKIRKRSAALFRCHWHLQYCTVRFYVFSVG